MKTFFKILAIFFSGVFLWAAYVQYNDPDAWLWYAIYGLAALASILFLLGKLRYWMAASLVVIYLFGAFFIWPENFQGVSIGEGDIVNIERGREALGLLIVSGVMLLYALRIKYVGKSKV